jgi:hypothetical protein
VNRSDRRATAIIRDVNGAREGVASVTAETAPQGPPSHSAIMAAQESNAIPTGPRITQAVSITRVSQWKRPTVTTAILARAAVGTAGAIRDPGRNGDTTRIGEDDNTVVLKKAEWNVLVEAIQPGKLSRV